MKSSEILTISGKRGYGKTTVAKTIISKLQRVSIWDPMHEYTNSYIPQSGSIDEFDSFLKRHWHTGNIFILVDEADQVMPEGRPLSLYANKIINLGRHRNIGMGMITRRLASLNKTAFSQSQEIILFHHFMPNDLRYLSEFITGADRLQYLQKFEYKTYQL